jgi:hypothetical protein
MRGKFYLKSTFPLGIAVFETLTQNGGMRQVCSCVRAVVSEIREY